MFNCKYIVADDQLSLDFKKVSEDRYEAIGDNIAVGQVILNGATFEASSDDIFMQFKLWLTRPERAVGKIADIEGKNLEELAEIYDELIVGAYIMSYHAPVVLNEVSNAPFQRILDWLRSTDFYTAPASTKYHDAVPGGLLVHALKVYNNMVELHSLSKFKSVDIAEATIAALAHDWCKIGYYESYQKNVKNEATGQWEKETAYRVNQKGIPLGHGAASLFIAMRMFNLSVDQALAIRHHMGVWNVADVEKSELQKANAEHPMVYLIQFADQLACTAY